MTMFVSQGDLLEAEYGIIAHGCNCQNVMDAGFANVLTDKYPQVLYQYHNSAKILGSVNMVCIQSEILYVANCFTQLRYGPPSKKCADKNAILATIHQCAIFSKFRHLPLFMPKIGCGLGGLNWSDLEQDIAYISDEVDTLIHVKHL